MRSKGKIGYPNTQDKPFPKAMHLSLPQPLSGSHAHVLPLEEAILQIPRYSPEGGPLPPFSS